MKHWRTHIATTLVALALLLGSTTPAFAASQCYGFVVESGNTFTVCINKINNGYDAIVTHESGPPYWVDFNLDTSTGTYGDDGDFYISAGQRRTYFFAVGYKSCERRSNTHPLTALEK